MCSIKQASVQVEWETLTGRTQLVRELPRGSKIDELFSYTPRLEKLLSLVVY